MSDPGEANKRTVTTPTSEADPALDFDGEDRKERLELLGESEHRKNRVSLLLELRGSADSKVNHLDNVRQANFTAAAVILAGLLGISFTKDSKLPVLVIVAFALLALMQIFRLVDKKFHSYSQGWQATRRALTRAAVGAYNTPEKTISVPRYDQTAEEKAVYRGKLPLIYHLLSILGLVSALLAAVLR